MTHADTLRALHRPGSPVVLPNAWDAASARAVEAAGFPAVATSSAAVALSLGYADGEATPVREMLDAVARIVRAVGVPVTADVERGYGLPPAQLAERLLATGAVGCNLEDSDPRTKQLIDVDRHADFLDAVREAAGADLVINARVDAYIRVPTDPLPVALERMRRFLAAGADCVYPIGATIREDITALTATGPVNILFTPATPTLAELAALGVARVSFGDGIHEALAAEHARMLAAIVAGTSPYPE
ncbi:carboxyvinyl-carboxyphosphonate phosphorylmutase [Asanoa ishikariensis]|uniref:2-Methylisocitrate lyase, PEP mutase family n=1 Tax=Asanoa ishikariensis TaxID=137265 RepID=A0A1H3S3U8_9ACTN|nr:isocitrate lyase/phosphoenolpyruvate mutase family protein [Asanoa ishikariensis]GIF66563.1 carboxyvinyl-carboxyphosphonate phosphorylmutase [Asanoa ishikariensis]SDZ32141.1 2-Methylisocitrate lyase, PEP mutase family [Asanoa ishikariensis]